MLNEDAVRGALQACSEPEFGLDIVELGMVRSVSLEVDTDAPGFGIAGVPARQRLSLRLAPVTQDEARRAQVRAQVENLLAGVAELSRVQVEWDEDAVWTPAAISPAGQRVLAERSRAGNRPGSLLPILNNERGSARGGR